LRVPGFAELDDRAGGLATIAGSSAVTSPREILMRVRDLACDAGKDTKHADAAFVSEPLGLYKVPMINSQLVRPRFRARSGVTLVFHKSFNVIHF
jgi:hypothetical protein